MHGENQVKFDRQNAKLDRLKAANEQAARDRLAQAKVEELAERQRELAEKATELANKNPDQDPEAKRPKEAA